jgi:FkbM family methyltransferase
VSLRGRLACSYARVFSRPSLVPFHRALFKLSVRGLGILNHHDMRASGEVDFLRRELRSRASPLVLDVGAHRGEYARMLLAISPGAIIHSFEPHPRSFAALACMAGLAGAHELGLSDHEGVMRLYDALEASGSQLATLVPGTFESLYSMKANATEVNVTMLDRFAEQQRIEHVDLLKLDVEGHELEVLRGATRLLAQRRIRTIQFEFGAPQLLSKASLLEFQRMLGSYTLHRLLGSGALALSRLQPYEREIFAYQNIVARLNGA